MQLEANIIMYDDRARIAMHKFKSCDASIWKCTTFGTIKNMHKDNKPANMHARLHHNAILNSTSSINAIGKNTIEEYNEENLTLKGDFEVNEVERELNK